jgi:light-regulated signal transduction histidine kinase (bacteriophytochrome)
MKHRLEQNHVERMKMSIQESIHVLELLKRDHREVETLFEEFERVDHHSKQRVADEVYLALETHTIIEDTLVYPAIRATTGSVDLVDQAKEEHHVVTLLIKELREMKISNELYPIRFKVLSELVEHHIDKEEGELFPSAEHIDIDWHSLGRKALTIKERMATQAQDGECSVG